MRRSNIDFITGMPNSSSAFPASRIISRSESLPITIETSVLLISLLKILFMICHPVSNDDGGCQVILATLLQRAPISKAPFRSRRKSLTTRPRPSFDFNLAGDPSGSTIHLFGTCSHDSSFELPDFSGRQAAYSSARLCRRPQDDSGSPARPPAQLRVRPVFAQHQVQPRGQLSGHRHFGHARFLRAARRR